MEGLEAPQDDECQVKRDGVVVQGLAVSFESQQRDHRVGVWAVFPPAFSREVPEVAGPFVQLSVDQGTRLP